MFKCMNKNLRLCLNNTGPPKFCFLADIFNENLKLCGYKERMQARIDV